MAERNDMTVARATTFSNVEALYFVADQAASGKREVNGHA